MPNTAIAPGPRAEDKRVDVLVVGSGTGLAAALAAREKGLSVLVVEKTALVGGSTARSGGAYWVPGNRALRDGGADTARAEAETYLDALVGDAAPRARREAFLDEGPAAIAMVERMTKLRFFWAEGYSDYHAERPGGSAAGRTCESLPFDMNLLGKEKSRLRRGDLRPPFPMPATGADYKWLNLTKRMPRKGLPIIARRMAQGLGGLAVGRHYVSGGQALAAGLFEGVIRAGIPVWTRARVVELVETGGRVAGAVVEQDGRRVTVTATRGVILAAGGYDHNTPMRVAYQSPSLAEDHSLGAEGNTGDAIVLGQAHGADLRLMREAWWFPAVPQPAGSYPKILLAERSLPGSLIVDRHGERFLDEAMDYMTFGQIVLRREAEGDPVGPMWIVFDQAYRDSYLFAIEIAAGKPLPRAWYDAGIAFKAESAAELARAAGLPEDRFAAALSRYNALCEAGRDTDFGRGDTAYDRYYGDPTVSPNPNLRPLSGALHAVRIVLSDLGTCGGLAADEKARVLRPDGAPIPGLYAIGNCAGNVFGHVYPGAGATIGQGLTFGYVAAADLAAQGGGDRP
ncbi:MAG: 3-ketosteroid-delta-1-dehydrogenase [Rhodovulum sulfidophilum]|uniref:3-ketosteroid-delta-1-dehydrogenase n=1 Tax=Rhodovulum sulfidophilum TaxID=35806 RepID=A0A2W5PVH2_RHOSU|nr:MAG: 3-ketosteroid-delta-1-dehydrogenase [Rhodovulum sulfidophilum]